MSTATIHRDEDPILKRHINQMLTNLDNGNNKEVYNEFNKIESKLSSTSKQYENSSLAAHIVIKAIALNRDDKTEEAKKLVQDLIEGKYHQNLSNVGKKDKNNNSSSDFRKHKPDVYTDAEAINCLGFFYNNELSDYQNLESHWIKAADKHPNQLEYKAQLFLSQIRNVQPEKMRQTAQSLYKMASAKNDRHKSHYLNWLVISMLAEQALADPNMNNEDFFSDIAKLAPPAENKLLSTLALKSLERNFVTIGKVEDVEYDFKYPIIKGHADAKLFMMAHEASGNWADVLQIYEGNHKNLTGMDVPDYEKFLEDKKVKQNLMVKEAEEKKKKEKEEKEKEKEKEQKEQPEEKSIEKSSEKPTEKEPTAEELKKQAAIKAYQELQKKEIERLIQNKNYRTDVCKCDLNIKIKNYKEAEKLAKQGLIVHGSDSWPFLLTLCIIAENDSSLKEDVIKYINQLCDDEISKKQESVRSGKKSEAKAAYHLLRSPFLAQLELITRLENEFSEEDIVGKVSGYIERFSTSIILFEDIDKYLGSLVDGNAERKTKLINFLKSMDISSITNKYTQRRTETAIILLRYRLSDDTLIQNYSDIQKFKDSYRQCLVDCPAAFPPMHENLVNASSPQTALMANPEPYVGDAYLLVIVQYYMKLYKESGNTDKNILFRCCCYLEELLDLSPSNQHIRLILVMLYVWELGCWEAGHNLMKELDIKHVQCETLGYVLTRHGWHCGEISNAKVMALNVLNFRAQSNYEAKEQVVDSFNRSMYEKVFEMMDYVKKMDRSLHARYCEIESMFSRSLEFVESLSQFLPKEDSRKVENNEFPLEFQISSEKMEDNRDLGLFDDWKCNAIERTKANQLDNYDQSMAWLKFRESLANLYLMVEESFDQDKINSQLTTVTSNYENGKTVLSNPKQSETDSPLNLTSEWTSAKSIDYPTILKNIIDFAQTLKNPEHPNIKSSLKNLETCLVNNFQSSFAPGNLFKAISGQSQKIPENLKVVDNADGDEVSLIGQTYLTDLIEIERTRLLLELIQQIYQIIISVIPIDKNSRKNNYKNEENLTAIKSFFESISKNTLLKFKNETQENNIFTKSNLAEHFKKDLEEVKQFNYEHSQKVVFTKMAKDLQINFNRVHNSIVGLVEKFAYYS